MATKKAHVATIDLDDEDEYEVDEEEEYDEDEEEDDDEPDVAEDTPEAWQAYVPQILEAIRDGWLDDHLKPIAYTSRERYKELNPHEFPGEEIEAETTPAPRDNMPILGRLGAVFPSWQRNVGDVGRMPLHSFRVEGNAYSKRSFEGRRFSLKTAYATRTRGTLSLPADTVMRVVEALDSRFIAEVSIDDLPPRTQLPVHKLRGAKYAFRYEYHKHLFEGAGK